ncbi:probable RNA-directed DNA polymerase from transposon X-element [Trichonephila clavipes]|uniref:Probable RNA-directed DNA polymerase from transposon X-element n=1 Tax=Trichonephila clavipes TaxID=2585209 RepID=A0A8X6VKD3_TRICX|nr:probable RNA-directed DNA polymerase from transposon X-element [Trichonephila clavipes]
MTYRNDRLSHRGGGTAIIIKRTIAHHSIDIHTTCLENTSIVIEGSQKITICCIYWPPRSPPQALIPDLLKLLRNRTKNCGFLLSYSSQPSTVPTRANARPATIDFGISCGLDDILVETHSELSSDHNPVQFIIPTTNNNRLYAQNCTTFTNWNLFQEILHSTIPGNPNISNANEIDEKIAQFTYNIHSAINQSSKVKVIKHNITFIPRSLRTKIAEKNRLRKQWQATRFPPIKQEVNRLQRQIRRDLTTLKKQEWDDILSDANSYPDDIHKIIRKKKTSQIHYPPLLGYRGLVYDTLDKANLFAETLEETFTENPEPYDDDHIEDVERQVRRFFRTTSFQPPPLTSPGEVCEIILDLENKKSPGADQIKNVALKSLPINAITKIFEKIILKRLKEHTDNHNLIPDFQHGFRSETSTNHQLLRLTNRVINGFNSGDTTGGAFLDVEKAFDRVWHDGLLYKMIKLNFPSYIIHLVNSYLSDRTFQVKILATLSRIGTVSAGSPQGSILSPLLYNIYTHDFPTTPTVDVCLFADDAAIIAQACNPDMVRRYLQQYLKKLQSWLRKWRIKINVGKSQAIIFKKGQYRNRLRELKLFRNSIPWIILPASLKTETQLFHPSFETSFLPLATQREVPNLFSSNVTENEMTSRTADLSLWFLLPSTTPDARFRQCFLFSLSSHSDGEKTHRWCVGAPCKEYVPRADDEDSR